MIIIVITLLSLLLFLIRDCGLHEWLVAILVLTAKLSDIRKFLATVSKFGHKNSSATALKFKNNTITRDSTSAIDAYLSSWPMSQ